MKKVPTRFNSNTGWSLSEDSVKDQGGMNPFKLLPMQEKIYKHARRYDVVGIYSSRRVSHKEK